MRRHEMSDRQAEIYQYIVDFIRERGISPSIRDIQRDLHISSTSVVSYNLNVLERLGKIIRNDKISRGISLPNLTPALLNQAVGRVPLLGTITAGSPLPDPEEIDLNSADQIVVPADVIPPNRLNGVYAMRVRGQSMIDALIDDGDIVLLRWQETAENGQMVAARLIDENAVTLKKFYREDGRIRLQPANATMPPIYTSPDNVQIQGRVIGVLRSLL
ncbi:MAG: LexA repressor [Chloroflexus sp.]|uniref:transcriptional repressor LexA n=1 Tax=Chloroflexus sp. TaxID=1904827 RepID=UPI0021DBFCD7|nr:transcriptional repressor LexA [Chloroflexus sp.]GIV87557.1 MAG: LexA repressor [Chloroflexus sp.]